MPDEWIGPADIARATEKYGTDKNFWNRVLTSQELRAVLGASPKGKYPAQVLPFFVWYAQQYESGNKYATSSAGMVMYDAWVAAPKDVEAANQIAPVGGALIVPPPRLPASQPPPPSGEGPGGEGALLSPQIRAQVAWIASEVVREFKEEVLPPIPDKLLTAEEAAIEVKMSEAWVRKNVPAVRMGARAKRWRLSDVQRFIEQLPRY